MSGIAELRTDDGNFIHPDLEQRVAVAIRRYPLWDAQSWLSPVAAILEVEKWLVEATRPTAELAEAQAAVDRVRTYLDEWEKNPDPGDEWEIPEIRKLLPRLPEQEQPDA